MFGGPHSCRKVTGPAGEYHLPSVRADRTRTQDGTTHKSTIGSQLAERSGKSLYALWIAMSGDVATRIPLARVPDRLSAAGAGIMGSGLLGQLELILKPAADGTIGFKEWSAAFGLEPAFATEPDGAVLHGSSSGACYMSEWLPHMRQEGTVSQFTPAPVAGLKGPTPSENWPGGHVDAHLEEDFRARLAADPSSVQRERLPFATESDQVVRPQPAPYATTTIQPPFATGEAPPAMAAPFGASSYAPRAPFATNY
uniref:Uncharacterized protein n=1 Tax=Haptolina brevifila TaxID=156173 RepID=A0A7S2HTH9_9EUKA|mmetsp:Transcript_5746/g.12073  ORF Transcript_5746/g.12073 Transcript_5746/m.12073 type:complete len:255 (+) Transcript_5746:48-812(+)